MDKHIEKRLEELKQDLVEFYEQESYEAASEVAEEIRELTYKYLGENHPDHATALNDQAVLYTGMGKTVEAEKLHLKALHIRQISCGETHPDYAESLHNLAHLYDSTDNYAKAKSLYLKATGIFRNSVGEDNPHYKESMQSLAELEESIVAVTDKINKLSYQANQLSQQGNYDQALTVVVKECEIVTRCYGKDSLKYAVALNHLGTIYFAVKNFPEADKTFREAIRIYETSSDDKFIGYTTSLFNLALLCRSMGDLTRAEHLFRQLADTKAETLGENHLEYADSLNHLAWLYHATARNKKAEKLYQTVIEIRGSDLDEHKIEYETSLNDLASLYMSEGRYLDAEPLYMEVEKIRRTSRDVNHLSYMISLNNLENLYRSMGKFELAGSLLQQRMDYQRNHPDLFSGALNDNDFNKEIYDNYQITLFEKNQQYWPPLQVGLNEASVDFYSAGYSEKHLVLNKELDELYAHGAFDKAEFMLKRKFSISRKALDKHEIIAAISKSLELNSSKMTQLNAMLLKNKGLCGFLSCPLLLEFFCNCVDEGLLLLEDPSLKEELDLYQTVVDLMLKGDFLHRYFHSPRLLGRQQKEGGGKLLALENLALTSFVNRQTVFTQKEMAKILEYTASVKDEVSFKNTYEQTDLLQEISPENYTFYKRTLQEYLTAKAMYRRIGGHLQGDWLGELNKFWDSACFWDKRWINVIRMFLGFLPAEKHPEFLRTCSRNLPGDLGYLEESRLVKGRPLIVMINTKYTSAATNEDIAKILGFFIETRALDYIFTEGSDGPVDRSFYQNKEKISDDAAKKQLAKAYLEKMTISGQEYLAITSWQNFHLWGIDNEPLWAKILKHLKEIAFETRDIEGGRKKNFLEYARAQSMSSTIRSVIIEKEAKVSALVIGSPYFLPFPNAYEVLSTNKSNRKPLLLSYIKISPAGLNKLTADSDGRYKEIMQGENLYDLST